MSDWSICHQARNSPDKFGVDPLLAKRDRRGVQLVACAQTGVHFRKGAERSVETERSSKKRVVVPIFGFVLFNSFPKGLKTSRRDIRRIQQPILEFRDRRIQPIVRKMYPGVESG
jgi:hypothetical protein